ncbi:MAG: chemotaxis protein CheA [Deltaproteobacteria bacterium]|nr:chemotaxis protein CheA [Deltaproteobacteria bacterium]
MSGMDRYLRLFLEESAKHLAKAEEILAADAPGPGERDALFREIHSLKGMAASMGYGDMAELAHTLADVFDAWRPAGRADPAGIQTALRACDRLSEMREDIAAGGEGKVPWSDLSLAPNRPSESGAEPDAERLVVRFLIDPGCLAPAARAYLILTRFRELGVLLSSLPSEEELLGGHCGCELLLTLEGVARADVEALCDTLTELKGIEFPGQEAASTALSLELVGPATGTEVEPVQPAAAAAESEVRLPETVPVPVAVLDEFVGLLGELTIARSRLDETVRPFGSEIVSEELGRMARVVRSFQERVMALRTLPFGLVAATLKRAVRSASAALGKEVELKLVGEGIGLDKTVLLQIADPLLHLVRNSVDHGVESPEERRRKGKPSRGTVEIRATRTRNSVEVVVADDGKGIDREAVRKKAVASGFFTEEESRLLPHCEVLACLFRPGFSTREAVTELSGRGVGLDVVKSHIEGIGGTAELRSTPGAGTEIRLLLPLSVAIVPVLTVAVGKSTLAFPVGSVVRTAEATPKEIEARNGSHVFLAPEGELPVLRVAKLLRLAGAKRFRRLPLVLLQTAGGLVAAAVDRFLREEELFIKPLKGPLRRLKGVTGYSILGDGRLVFLLDPANLT